jgi:hypothetical protein
LEAENWSLSSFSLWMCYCDLSLLPTIQCFSVGKLSVAQDGVKKFLQVCNFVFKMVSRNPLGLVILCWRWCWEIC